MGKPSQKPPSLLAPLLCGLAAIAVVLGLGCAGSLYGVVAYDYFDAPDAADPWSRKIEYWQARERLDRSESLVATPAPVAGPGRDGPDEAGVGELKAKYTAFRQERKRAMARELAEWIQVQARQHYVPDGAVDHWATLEETFEANGDDCDGLELLSYNFLRDLGFSKHEVYRAIVYRRSDGQHHMVTFWFEDSDDPWVIDPTGAMTSGMPRMSQVPDWSPLKVFSEDEDFSVRSAIVARHAP